jgi:hypothetical protein
MSSLGEGMPHKGPAEVTSHRGAAYKLRGCPLCHQLASNLARPILKKDKMASYRIQHDLPSGIQA